jgi:hypothetical protein
MRYDTVRSREGFDILDAAEIWLRSDAAPLAELEAALARAPAPEPQEPRR